MSNQLLGRMIRPLVETNELEEFEVKAIIAADGVNSEIAEMTGARNKFTTEELYQGVKVVVKLPEEIMEQRFEIGPNEGAATSFCWRYHAKSYRRRFCLY